MSSVPATDYTSQLNLIDRDLWQSQNAQTADLKSYADRQNFQNEYRGNRAFDFTNNHMTESTKDLLNNSERQNFQNEYRGNRAFDYLNNHITTAAADGLAAVERTGRDAVLSTEKNASVIGGQNERIAAMLGNQAERIGANGIATTEKVGNTIGQQNERVRTDLSIQNERIGSGLSTQNERIGAAVSTQNERIANQGMIQAERIGAALSTQNERIANENNTQNERLGAAVSTQNERIANQTSVQAERIANDVKSVLTGNFTQTLDGLHDIRARNTDNFAKTWVAQAEQNTLAYRNTADLARLAIEHSGKQALDLQKVEGYLSKQALDNTAQLMRLNLEGFAKTQIDIAKSEACLSKQMVETEAKLADKMSAIETQRLRDKSYFGAARGLVLDEYHHGNFRPRCRSGSPRRGSPHRRHSYYEDDYGYGGGRRGRRDHREDVDQRINVVTNIRDRNDALSGSGALAGAVAV